MSTLASLLCRLLLALASISGKSLPAPSDYTSETSTQSYDYDDETQTTTQSEIHADETPVPEHTPPRTSNELRLLTEELAKIAALENKIQENIPQIHSLRQISAIYDRILTAAVDGPAFSTAKSDVVDSIFRSTARLLAAAVRLNASTPPFDDATRTRFALLSQPDDSIDYRDRHNFAGSSLFWDDAFEIFSMCVPDGDTGVAVVVYPAGRLPLRPRPHVERRHAIAKLQAFDVVVAKRPGVPSPRDGAGCGNFQFLDTVVFRWLAERNVSFAKYGCQRWSDQDWTADDCTLAYGWDVPANVTCFCDVRGSGRVEQFVMFALREDLAIDNYDLEVSPADYVYVGDFDDVAEELASYADAIAELASDCSNITERAFFVFLSMYMNNVMSIPREVLLANATEALLEDIGTVLRCVEPDAGQSFVGRRNVIVSAFVMAVDSYDGDPLAGFAMYKLSMAQAMYYRLHDDVDLNVLFSASMEFSVLFDAEVLGRNSRYAFLVYPLNVFFKATEGVGRHKVENMRVVDVVLTPYPNVVDSRDQWLHLFLGRKQYEYVDSDKFGCGYWSAAAANWTTDGCRPNAELYRGVCSCNMAAHFDESRTRGQYIYFEYKTDDFNSFSGENHQDYVDTEFIEGGIHALRELRSRYRDESRTVHKAMDLLYQLFRRTDGTYRLLPAAKEAVIDNARNIVLDNSCSADQIYNTFGCVCFDARRPFAAFAFNASVRNYALSTFAEAEFNGSRVFARDVAFAVRVSPSVATLNLRYAALVYKEGVFLRPPPAADGVICASRVVDLALSPRRPAPGHAPGQWVQLYLAQATYAATRLACARWSKPLADWTELGCRVDRVAGTEVCNCSVETNFAVDAAAGGQFVAFSVSPFRFDDDAFFALGDEAMTDSDQIFTTGSELIRNASHIPADDDAVVKILSVYKKMLTFSRSRLLAADNGRAILADLEVVFARHCRDVTRSYHHTCGIQGSWSVNKADVSVDLFSNAVLSAASLESAVLTDMALAVFGYTDTRSYELTAGVFFAPTRTNVLAFQAHDPAVQPRGNDSLFAAFLVDPGALRYQRLVLLVYPMNLSPYPSSMTSRPVFNSRQLDVYLDVDDADNMKWMHLGSPAQRTDLLLEVYFHPTDAPTNHTSVSCASWAEPRWSTELCVMDAGNATAPARCRCNLTGRSVTRIILFEFTDLDNFTFLTQIKGPSIVYLIGAVLSLFGFSVIFATAALFSKWREELGNKIMMQLSLSSFLYLCLTMFRETHLIFAANNYVDVGLIVFTVAVHYTRLVHYAWGLVMSVLQYKKFSGVVGASAISHLLLKVSLAAWGTPLAPLLVLLLWDQDVHFCSADKLTHYVLYLVPGAIITAASTSLLVAIICTITSCFGLRAVKDLQRHGVNTADVMKRHLMQTLMMFFLFGIPTIFEMFNDIASHSQAAEYIGKILDPIQGFVMFLFFVVFDTKTHAHWHLKIYGKPAQPKTQKTQQQQRGGNKGTGKKGPAKKAPANKRRVAPKRRIVPKAKAVGGDQVDVAAVQHDAEQVRVDDLRHAVGEINVNQVAEIVVQVNADGIKEADGQVNAVEIEETVNQDAVETNEALNGSDESLTEGNLRVPAIEVSDETDSVMPTASVGPTAFQGDVVSLDLSHAPSDAASRH